MPDLAPALLPGTNGDKSAGEYCNSFFKLLKRFLPKEKEIKVYMVMNGSVGAACAVSGVGVWVV